MSCIGWNSIKNQAGRLLYFRQAQKQEYSNPFYGG